MKNIGIVAGNGRFPLLAAHYARAAGHRVVICAIRNEADEQIEKIAHACMWVKIGELKKLVKFFRSEDVTEIIMAGKVEKVKLFQDNVKPDLEMLKVVMKTRDFKDDSLLSGICDYLESEGIKVLDSTLFMKSSMPGEGVLGRKKPSKEAYGDIKFGFELAKAVAGLDIGQTVVVKKKAVLAIEAIEGTDQAIHRGGVLGGEKVTVVKVAKPNQDMRFDVPAIGLRTLKELIKVKAQVFAFEAHKTILMDQDEFIHQANKHGIAIVGVGSNEQ